MTFAVDQDQGKRPSTAVIASIVGAAMLIAAFMVVFAVRSVGGGKEAPGTTPQPTAEGSGGRPDVERLTPENAEWVDVEGIRLPRTAAGPARIEGRRAFGFARTPAGAALAGMYISLNTTGSLGPATFRPTVAEQVIGADKERFLSNAEREYKAAAPGGLTPDGAVVADLAKTRNLGVRVWGYRMDSFDPSVASLQLLSRYFPSPGASPAFTNFAVTMRWVDGDWRMVAPLNGTFENTATRLAAVPAGYTLLGGE